MLSIYIVRSILYVKMDTKDEIILAELVQDARCSARKIAQKAGKHHNTVSKRIQELQDMKVILNTYPRIVSENLGYMFTTVYCSVQDQTIQQRIIDRLVKHPAVTLYEEYLGSTSLSFNVETLNLESFQEVLHLVFTGYLESVSDLRIVPRRDNVQQKELSTFQMDLLQYICKHPKASYSQIALHLKSTAPTVLRNFRLLSEKDIFRGFSSFIDLRPLGLRRYRVLVQTTASIQKIQHFLDSIQHGFVQHAKLGGNIYQVMLTINLEPIYEVEEFEKYVYMYFSKEIQQVHLLTSKNVCFLRSIHKEFLEGV